MRCVTIFEFDTLVAHDGRISPVADAHPVPAAVFGWLQKLCLATAEQGASQWLRLTQRGGRHAVQVTSHVGVIQAPDGFQIEVLPKLGRAIEGGPGQARQMLIRMLACLDGFRHIATESANLSAAAMSLPDVFVGEFLRSVEHVIQRGLRSAYVSQEDNLPVLRGRLLTPQQLRHNLCRADRFYCRHDAFLTDRPENRILHSALRQILTGPTTASHQRRGRELVRAFDGVPLSRQPSQDFQRVQLDRNMSHYRVALAWARLILDHLSPATSAGRYRAPSMLFPMAALFEAFVAERLARQLAPSHVLKRQVATHHMVRHGQSDWFRLQPDLVVQHGGRARYVLDTKWKLLDARKANGSDKYGLAQGDFYQLQAYGHGYLDGKGDLVLIYPKSDRFPEPLPLFEFPKSAGLRLWVLPFCMKDWVMLLPDDADFLEAFGAMAAKPGPAPAVAFTGLVQA